MDRKDDIFSSIVINNTKRESKILSNFACKSGSGNRKFPDREKVHDRKNIRPIFFHDTDKIIHSEAYSRYIDKTQVFYLFENDHITHRVLHVQFVSKIARVIGRCLRLNEDLIEAIALGHDIGHSPYGHDGESILNELCRQHMNGYFCHNAQSMRVLTEIENKGKGLNLSLQVLDGILAHNGEVLDPIYKPHTGKTWDQLMEEYNSCFSEKDFSKKISPTTLEGCVVRISDVIAYIGRDIEDAIELKIIQRKDIPEQIQQVLGNSNDQIINKIAMDLIGNSYDKRYLKFSQPVFEALEDLKKFNYEKIYFNPQVKREYEKVKKIFELLFDQYLDDLNSNRKRSPIFKYHIDRIGIGYADKTTVPRIIADFISGMTDDFFNSQFDSLFVPKKQGY